MITLDDNEKRLVYELLEDHCRFFSIFAAYWPHTHRATANHLREKLKRELKIKNK